MFTQEPRKQGAGIKRIKETLVLWRSINTHKGSPLATVSSLFVFLRVLYTDHFPDERKSPLFLILNFFSEDSYSNRGISNFTGILLEISTVPILCWKFIVGFWNSLAGFPLSLQCCSCARITISWWRKAQGPALWTRQERQVVPLSGLTLCW